VIRSFGDRATEDFFHGRNTKRARRIPTEIVKGANRKLDMVNAASKLQDLRSPPSNRLEKLVGDLEGLWSIRINNQWRVIFDWRDGDAYAVRVVDYH
jgi:toxin HigB-1